LVVGVSEVDAMFIVPDVDVPRFVEVSTGAAERTPLHSVQVTIASVGVPLRVIVIGLLPALVINSAYMKA